MEAIIAGLNDAQEVAVTSPAKVLQVLAPPGSGKTKTLTARVAHLITEHGLHPANIIVCTFTIKAAKDMRERIEGFIGKEVSSRLKLGTFHSIARRLLASHGERIGIKGKFGIADTSDSKAIVSRIIKERSLTISPAVARSRISKLKADGITVERHLATSKTSKVDDDRQQELSKVYEAYEGHLGIANLLDYDDLLLRCTELLRGFPECVSRIEAVLVDEFQDTNHIQYDLMNLFAQGRQCITIVGDPDQSIYGWRSAKIENLQKMQNQYPDTHVVNLEENYRSSSCILFAAQEVIEQDKYRPQKCLAPTHSAGEQPTLRLLKSAGQEAEWIVSEMQRTYNLTGGLLTWDDYAVLLRSANLSRLVEAELARAGIPYRMVGGHRFFDRVEVKLVLDYLRVLDHPDHSDALSRIVNIPSRKIGEATLSNLLQEADERKVTLWSVILKVARGEITTRTKISPQAQKGLQSFVHVMLTGQDRIRRESEDSLASFIGWLVQKLELKSYLKSKYSTEEVTSRWGNVQELINQAAEASSILSLEQIEEHDEFEEKKTTVLSQADRLHSLLVNVTLSTDAKARVGEEEDRQCVTLSTMHAAKGLEWPVVFIPAAYKGSIPHSRSEDGDEERRLLYVAMTRAQALLYVSSTRLDSRKAKVDLSPFLASKEVRRRHAKRGPTLTHELVVELAKILRRPCDNLQIAAGRARMTSLEDDRLPLRPRLDDDDEDDLQGSDLEDVSTSILPPNSLKRRWLDDCHNYGPQKKPNATAWAMATTTMQRTSDFSISNTKYSSTFISASALPQDKENQEPVSAVKRKFLKAEAIPQAASRARRQKDMNDFFGPLPPHRSLPKMPPGSARTEAVLETSHQSNEDNKPPSRGHLEASTQSSLSTSRTKNALTGGVGEQTRRALGVRRSVVGGWNDRMAREIRKPS